MQQQQKPKERNAYCFSTMTFESRVRLIQSVKKYLKLSCLSNAHSTFGLKFIQLEKK